MQAKNIVGTQTASSFTDHKMLKTQTVLIKLRPHTTDTSSPRPNPQFPVGPQRQLSQRIVADRPLRLLWNWNKTNESLCGTIQINHAIVGGYPKLPIENFYHIINYAPC